MSRERSLVGFRLPEALRLDRRDAKPRGCIELITSFIYPTPVSSHKSADIAVGIKVVFAVGIDVRCIILAVKDREADGDRFRKEVTIAEGERARRAHINAWVLIASGKRIGYRHAERRGIIHRQLLRRKKADAEGKGVLWRKFFNEALLRIPEIRKQYAERCTQYPFHCYKDTKRNDAAHYSKNRVPIE